MSMKRAPIIIVLAASLVCSTLVRKQVVAQRAEIEKQRGLTVEARGVSRLPSFALGLVLGGLRGPLVMALWTSSENQKNDRNLADFDSKVEMIRLLQPEFDSVHLFQMWNKAYNISVQVVNAPAKYAVILDALDYGFAINREKPDNINTLFAIGGIYFDKFGNSSEKGYFSPRLREDSLPAEDRRRLTFDKPLADRVSRTARLYGADRPSVVPRQRTINGQTKFTITLRKTIADRIENELKPLGVEFADVKFVKTDSHDGTSRRIDHDRLLTSTYEIDPIWLKPRGDQPQTFTAADGSTLPYLAQFKTYPYGVSPFAVAYSYFKRCQWFQQYRDQSHIQMSDRVVSSRPALALSKWTEEESRRARRAEMELLNLPVPEKEEEYENITANLPFPTVLPHVPLLDEAIFSYDRASDVATATFNEFNYHVTQSKGVNGDFKLDFATYHSHMSTASAQIHYFKADADYLRAMIAGNDADRAKFISAARSEYAEASRQWSILMFNFYCPDDVAAKILPPNRTRADLNKMTNDELNQSAMRLAELQRQTSQAQSNDDISELTNYIVRCQMRLGLLPK